MNTPKSDSESPPQAKKPKSDCGESSSQMVAPAEAPNQEISAHILRLNYDYFEIMFKSLSLKDLLKIRLTCKQLKDYADINIRVTYPKFTFDYGRVYINLNMEQFRKGGFCVIPSIEKGRLLPINEIKRLRPNLAKLIKTIECEGIELSDEDINILKGILSPIETLEMNNVHIDDRFFMSFFKYCPNVKRLIIREISGEFMIETDNTWLQRKYPNLESVHLNDFNRVNLYRSKCEGESVKELVKFLKLNPNVRTFETTSDYFLKNWKWMIEGNATFNLLIIRYSYAARSDYKIFDALKQLHAKGVYKRLQFHNIRITSQEDMDPISTIPAVEALYFRSASCDFVIPPSMTNLKEIGFLGNCPKRDIGFFKNFENLESLASSLINVDRIYLDRTAFVDILPFIRFSAGVKELYVDYLFKRTHFKNGIVDVAALNKERAKLDGACKLTIYVKEDIFLATKWASSSTKYRSYSFCLPDVLIAYQMLGFNYNDIDPFFTSNQ